MGWWNGTRSINTFKGQWVPQADINRPLTDFALKFEINAKTDWALGRLYIVKDYDWGYLVNFAPWKKADGSTGPFKTDGWQTVVVPLTEFRTKSGSLDGTGTSASSLKTLLKDNVQGSIHFMLVNPETTAVENFEVAIDNIRIVRLQ
jgi:hypothetical protein